MKRALLALCCALACGAAFAQGGEEVPFITSPDNVTQEMLRIANVGAGDHVIDLGSGDGRIVIVAAKRFGATGLGVEIDPALVRRSQQNARDAGVAQQVEFRVQDLFETDLSRATVVTMYLLPEFNLRLRPSLLALKPGTRIVSHDWDMGDWKPDATTVVDVPEKKVGLDKFSRVHLWVVPAKVDGLWCGADGPLVLRQAYQELAARLGAREVKGRVEGADILLEGRRLTLAGDTLRSPAASYVRARSGAC
ncbi:class I SAM-dependent methyltransferase [Ramlibacter sp. USB13]|uniref:Class I SAM-dependent methyltransferase n=1 Tax=Ramlibacter cellulosilyticus TaxID=2764187 RepID=A0A923MWX3_9BURK|nr:methyltransferase domain-containing protein [Ramlibacter cellulosilyticus]MBC5786198.1 class I SAM-dependent methyltransferase [Ramlibacter cellulosilyticus]